MATFLSFELLQSRTLEWGDQAIKDDFLDHGLKTLLQATHM